MLSETMALDVVGVLSFLTLVSGILIVLYVLELITRKAGLVKDSFGLWKWMGSHARVLAFIVTLTAMCGSLYFSEVLGYAPCNFCWYQRIFMYSQVFLFATALVRNESKIIWRYAAVLSVIGAAIAGFHYLSQVADFSLPCSAVGYSASCSERFFFTFGYITIPMMALTAFLAVLVLAHLARVHARHGAYSTTNV